MLGKELEKYCNEILHTEQFQDYCANGLQVEGKVEVNKIITGVTASQALLDVAVEKKADAVLVHHGYLWKNSSPYISGMKKNRLKTLLLNDMNLFAYHLPLDANPIYGTNAQLAKLLDITLDSQENITDILFTGKIAEILGDDLAAKITEKLERKPLYVPGKNSKITTVGICTGGGQDFIEKAVALNLDAYITGEVSERTVHIAREEGIHFYAAGHHATERYGIKALGEHLAKVFSLNVEFVDIDNPV